MAGLPASSTDNPKDPSAKAVLPESSLPRQTHTASPFQYPWSYRSIPLPAATATPDGLEINPLPRYGFTAPAIPPQSSHMLIFGGLVDDHAQNDLWSMAVNGYSMTYVQTSGNAPSPRVGHASVMTDNFMLIWGGDTKVNPSDKLDEGLYVLDLSSKTWTRMPVSTGPAGRYGHAACLLGDRFYVFGGQAEGEMMDDLWSYDIRQGNDNPHVWEEIAYETHSPSPRSRHTLLSYQNALYVFGGTDGIFHYNDIWRFDPESGAWTELSCVGYTPVPREGHAAAIVDDVIYVFGGRDSNGQDLAALAAFKISNSRWYSFQNMGPAPSARSGHAMVAAEGTICVLGGEASGIYKDDPTLIHKLDTVQIVYPADKQPSC